MQFPGNWLGRRKRHTRSRPPHHRHKGERPRAYVTEFIQALTSHPLRTLSLGGLGLALFAFVATTSLPLALSGTHPHAALFLSPEHPKALITLARQERQKLFLETQAPDLDDPGQQGIDSIDSSDEAEQQALPAETDHALPSPEVADSVDPQIRRARIRDLATRVLVTDPLNAEAYRLLGEVEPDPDKARQYLIEALARSRRETVAAFLLMNQNYENKDAPGVVRMADTLLRTRPQLNQYTLSYLHSLVLTPEGREALVEALRTQPSWRMTFMRSLGRPLATSDEPLALFELMKQKGDTPTNQELAPFLDARMRATRSATAAYNIWLQLLPDDQLTRLRPVNNLDFSNEFSGLPFDWRLARSTNVFVNFQPREKGQEGRVLRVRFGSGRFTFGPISQVTFLRPGTYRFEGMQSGRMSARRGMVWQISCYTGNRLIGQSDQLMGAPRGWRPFYFEFSVPEDPACEAQTIRLIHDARSPSEQIASGEVLFDKLEIQRVTSK